MAGAGRKERQDWACRSCTTKRGKPLINFGTSLKCQGCRLHKKDVYGGPVPPKEPSMRAPAKGKKRAPWTAEGKLEGELAAMRAELDAARKKLRTQESDQGGAAAMHVDDGKSGEDASAASEIKVCEAGLATLKDVQHDWATGPREDLKRRLAAAKDRLFAAKPLHARVQALAHRQKNLADKLSKMELAEREAEDRVKKAQDELELKRHGVRELKAQQVALQAEQSALQQQVPVAPEDRPPGQSMEHDVIKNTGGLTLGDLAQALSGALAAHPDDTMPTAGDLPQRLASALGGPLQELMLRRQRERAAATEAASAPRTPAASVEGDDAAAAAHDAGTAGGAAPAAAAPRWDPAAMEPEKLRQTMAAFSPGPAEETSDAMLARATELAVRGFNPY
ncbi:unnamed protein product [Prorocentrum cordatum]|uniref:Uncharacterized protein n=1 Tax=Prorocentrum cordatum TaxID=2364126 RepID=A0ABN9XIG2_9DINO|nr:unnamed protein product [Polarella glacialis]